MKKKYSKLKCGFYSLLLFVFFSLNSCNNENKKTKSVDMTSKEIKAKSKTDSLTISIELPARISTGFDLPDKFDFNGYLSFVNSTKKDTTISKTIYNHHSHYIINYNQSLWFSRDSMVNFKHYYLLDKSTKKIEFVFKGGDLVLKKHEGNVFVVDELVKAYDALRVKIFVAKGINKEILNASLDSLFTGFSTKYSNDVELSELNKMAYLNYLQIINPNTNEVENYLKQLNKPLIFSSSALLSSSIRNNYIINNFSKFNFNNFNNFNNNSYNRFYLREMELGFFLFLRHKKRRGKLEFKPAIDWLKTTEFYKKDSVYIKKQIQPLSNDLFKEKIKNLRLSSVALKESSLSKIIQKHPSPYYLIDFWATWCAPCIGGIKEMKKMKFPKNVKILSFSVDAEKDTEKWQQKTKELEQTISYLIDNRIKENKAFLKFIELHSIPRYILIDKNMNLIDQAFYHPSELQFLPKLRDVKNAKYW